MQYLADDIEELLLLDDIEYIEKQYKDKYGQYPARLSNWNTSNTLVDANNHLILPSSYRNVSDYIFSYSLDHSKLISTMNYKSFLWRALVTHSGSSAIVSVVKWLSIKNVKKILILCPRYFTVPHLFDTFGIDYEMEYCKRTNNGYKLPNNTEHNNFDAIWITDPIYCTGEYLDSNELKKVYYDWTYNHKYFIVDNCLSDEKCYFGLDIEPSCYVCIIVSPSKNLCINAYKFATILFHKNELHHFECWSDVFQGCLPESSVQAIEFFTSNQYNIYKKHFNKILSNQEKILYNLLTKKSILIDKNASGYLRTVYFPEIDTQLGKNTKFLKDIFFATGASFIPNIRNELDPILGLSFRINLAGFDTRAQGALARTVEVLTNL